MSFSALSLAWLFALLVPLVIFYFLKLRRPRQVISSLVLWRQVINDQRVNAPFQRFKRNILLLLQILLLTLLVLAAMQPFLRREPVGTGRLPILIDVSASMAALDQPGGQSRLEEAKEQVRERIKGLPAGQQICLIAFSKQARKLTDFTDNHTDLRDALERLEVEDVPGELEEGLQLTQALARSAPFTRALVLTDGNLPAQTNFQLPFELTLQKLGAPGANVGITGCSARRSRGGDWELLVQIGATDPIPANTAGVSLYAGEQEIARDTVNLVAGNSLRVAFRLSAEQGSGKELVRVVLHPSGFDALASDNEAWLSLPAIRSLDVHIPERFGAFRQAMLGVESVRLFPQSGGAEPAMYDLAIGETGSMPPALVSCTFGELPELLRPLVTVTKNEAQTVRAVDWQRDSPFLQHVSFDEILFLDDPVLATGKDTAALRAQGWDSLVDGPHGPLMLAHVEDRSAQVHLLFNLDHSTFPYRVGFPVFVSNLVASALRLTGLAETAAIETGVFPPQPAKAGATVTVRNPVGTTRNERANERGMLTGVPAPRAGAYVFSAGGESWQRGASLLNAAETGLATLDAVSFGDRISVTANTVATKSDRSLWWILSAVGLAVLLLEWWWFQRRPF